MKHVGQAIRIRLRILRLETPYRNLQPNCRKPFAQRVSRGLQFRPGIIIAGLLTALFQSSAATLGIAITAAHSGLLTIDAAMPIVLGANVGTCVSAIVSSLGATVDAKVWLLAPYCSGARRHNRSASPVRLYTSRWICLLDPARRR